MSRSLILASAVVALGLIGCGGRHSPAGFRLPESGSVSAGEAAFARLDCHACHTVAGVEFPASAADSALKIKLGGRVPEIRTDGYLVTSVLHPSHRLAAYPRDQISVEGESRMPDFTATMTVREMIDIVAFLQEHYELSPPTAIHP